MKKLDNFIKREREIQQWRDYAGPEDIDYFECQAELQQELLKSYNNVERIIGEDFFQVDRNFYLIHICCKLFKKSYFVF